MSGNMGFTDLYLEGIQEEIDHIAMSIIDGKCTDFEDYKHKVGIIQGLRLSERILRDEMTKVTQMQEYE